jgi:hypothetical protein
MRRSLPLLLLLSALMSAGCGASKPASETDGYAIQKDGDGNVTVLIGEGASGETMMAALIAAADATAWEPPEAAAGLTRVDQTKLDGPGGTTVYSYRTLIPDGRFNVYVYRAEAEAEPQVEETKAALDQLVSAGRIEAWSVADALSSQPIDWNGEARTLYRVAFDEKMDGTPLDSYLYLLRDDIHWIKVRATFPAGELAPESVEALVLDVLDGDA